MEITGSTPLSMTRVTNHSHQTRKTFSTPKKNVSNAIKSSHQLYEHIASKYDVRNITYSDLKNLTRKLYESGEIDLTTMSVLEHATGAFVDGPNGFKFQPHEGKVDVISKLKGQIAFQKEYTGKVDPYSELAFKTMKKIEYFRLNRSINTYS